MIRREVQRVQHLHLGHVIYLDNVIVPVTDDLQAAFVEDRRTLVEVASVGTTKNIYDEMLNKNGTCL